VGISKQKIIDILASFRYLFSDASRSPNLLWNDLVELKSTKKVIYPCDVIELKDILISEEIENSTDVPLFSMRFADKYLKRYPIFIVIDRDLLSVASDNYGGVVICKTNNLNVEDSILQVIINKPIDDRTMDTIINILSLTNFKDRYSVSNSIPGISSMNSKL
jgi:hypothetical protein